MKVRKARQISAIILVVGLLLITGSGMGILGGRAQGPEPDKPLQVSTPMPTPPPQLEPTPTPTPSVDSNKKEGLDRQSAEQVGPLSSPTSNDDFNGAVLITALPYQQTVDTTGATVAPDDPDMGCGAGVNSNTVWYRLVPSFSGLIEVNTFRSDYDTVLAVFTGTQDSLKQIACSDDAGGTFQSQVILEVKAGQTYYMSVADYGSPGGGLSSLTVKLEPSGAVKTKVLEPGDDFIHGFTYYNGYLWASTRTSPARILKVDPDTLDYQRIILSSGLDDGEDIIAAENYIWVILYTQPAKIIRVDPETLQWQVAITFGSGELSYGGSLEYAFGYLWAGGHDRKIAKINLSDLTYQIYAYSTITSDSQFHALTSGGEYIWASAPHHSWWYGWYAGTIVRINPSNPTDYSTVYINTWMSDDIAYSDNHLYTGSEEEPSFVYKFADNLTYSNAYAFDHGSYGTFTHNDGDIWSAHVGSPGRIIEFNTSLEIRSVYDLPIGFNNANEMAFDPVGNMYVTAWESPAKIVKFEETTNPDGNITSPAEGVNIGPGTVNFTADAWDNPGGSGVDRIEFWVYYDGIWHNLGYDSSSPYAIEWETPTSLRSQRVKFGIHVVDNVGNVAIDPGGTRTVNYVESLAPGVDENWVRRVYLNQRSLPNGDVKCGAASMAMVLAMNGLITSDYDTMASKANEMYPNTLQGDTAYVYKMRNELRRQGAISDYHNDTVDQGWNRIKQEVDAGRPVIVRTENGVVTEFGHYFVAVGYRESSSSREIITYDPYGKWLGTCCENNYDRNSTDPSSHKGKWVFYDFDTVFGDWLITARNPADQMAAFVTTDVPSTPPDEVSDEPEDIVTYKGIKTEVGGEVFLPLILRNP